MEKGMSRFGLGIFTDNINYIIMKKNNYIITYKMY